MIRCHQVIKLGVTRASEECLWASVTIAGKIGMGVNDPAYIAKSRQWRHSNARSLEFLHILS
jgi:hypothetical protein